MAKAVSEGKKAPYIVASGEKIANKDAQAVNKGTKSRKRLNK